LPSEKLLDIGIGTGLASIHFSDVGLWVYGLDVSQEMLAACGRNHSQKHWNDVIYPEKVYRMKINIQTFTSIYFEAARNKWNWVVERAETLDKGCR